MLRYRCEFDVEEILLSIKVDSPPQKYCLSIATCGSSYIKVGEYKTLDEAIKRINLFLNNEEVKQCT